MNIKDAKEYIKDTVKIYLKKDEFGDYRIPVSKQRPIFLLGAPGIGKTAIMEQIAEELDIALVSYSMTHHTRQSALGLPFIEKKEYDGKSVDVSEYTMSEIIASVYETIKQSGVREGILFLDEINCVSETLYPSMLQFLQFKTFGRHKVPEGWVVVTAGNPTEFNRSSREFDVVTLDRLKVIEVEADFNAWKQYAYDKGLNGAILNFLDLKKDYFYKIETTVDGRQYVTARGWEDLSDILSLYEEEGLKVDERLVGQYIKCDTVIREFTAYYELYNKYKRNYHVDSILEGKPYDDVLETLKNAGLDERLSLTGLLIDKVKSETKYIMEEADLLTEIAPSLRNMKSSEKLAVALETQLAARDAIITKKSTAGTLSYAEKRKQKKIKSVYHEMLTAVNEKGGSFDETVAVIYNDKTAKLKASTDKEKERLHFFFEFIKNAFSEESNEMLVAITELTLHNASARFFATFGSPDYDTYNEKLMVVDRSAALNKEIAGII